MLTHVMVAKEDEAKADAAQQTEEDWEEARPVASNYHLTQPELPHMLPTCMSLSASLS